MIFIRSNQVKEYGKSYLCNGKKLPLEEIENRIKNVLKEKYLGWELHSDISQYKNARTPLVFINEEGYPSRKTLDNLVGNKGGKMTLFDRRFEDINDHNMNLFLSSQPHGVTLAKGTKFNGMKIPVRLVCPIHGEFEVWWQNYFERNQNCPQCKVIQKSKGEGIIYNFLTENNIDFSHQKHKKIQVINPNTNTKLRFDFVVYYKGTDIPMCAIEYNGEQHYRAGGKEDSWFGSWSRVLKGRERDTLKKEWCIKQRIPLLILTYKCNESEIEENLKKYILNKEITKSQIVEIGRTI